VIGAPPSVALATKTGAFGRPQATRSSANTPAFGLILLFVAERLTLAKSLSKRNSDLKVEKRREIKINDSQANRFGCNSPQYDS
jgi:hypothetical protein